MLKFPCLESFSWATRYSLHRVKREVLTQEEKLFIHSFIQKYFGSYLLTVYSLLGPGYKKRVVPKKQIQEFLNKQIKY